MKTSRPRAVTSYFQIRKGGGQSLSVSCVCKTERKRKEVGRMCASMCELLEVEEERGREMEGEREEWERDGGREKGRGREREAEGE